MKLGVFQFSTDYSMRPDHVARAAEERGFESIFYPEHTHIPVSRKSPWPGGKELPKEYWHTNDLFIALAMAAAVTKKIRLGTGICLVIERDPIITAKEVATIDALSGQRWRVLRERMLAMKQIWTQDEAEYHGKHVNFDPIWSWPKPAQRPHPPVLVGGSSAAARSRAVAYGEGWMPIPGRGESLGAAIQDLRARAEKAGRDPIPVTVFGVRPDEKTIAEYRELGVDRGLFGLPPATADSVLPLLDGYAKLLGK